MNINIAFESGGIKGLAYVGVIRYLEERGIKVYKASGCSVGSIFAALVVAGYKSKEIETIIDSINIKEIIETNSLKEGIRNKGINKIDKLEKRIEEVLLKKNIKTFQDLKHGEDYLLKIIVTDNIKKEMVIIPNDLVKYGINKDTFKVSKAIAMSCSIPLFYSQYKIGKNVFVDGGATNRFPIEVVCDGIHPVLGVKLVRQNFKALDFFQNKIYKIKKEKTKLKGNNIVILELDIPNVKATQFSKGLALRKELYKRGYIIAKNNL